MIAADRSVPARVFMAWWERLIQLDQEEAGTENAADVGEAGSLLDALEDVGHANGAIRRSITSEGYGSGSTASFCSGPNPDFDWANGKIDFAPPHPYGSIDLSYAIEAVVRVTGIPVNT